LVRVRESARTGVATIMPVATTSSIPADWLAEGDALGYGAVVSDDGWIAVEASVLKNARDIEKEIAVWINGTSYSVTNVARDVLTSVVMLQTTARNVSAIGFATTNDIRAGEMLFAVQGQDDVVPLSVSATDDALFSLPERAEVFATTWTLHMSPAAVSTPLLNGGGELVGFVAANDTHGLPLHHAIEAIRDVLRSGETTYPALGAYVVDLADAYNISPELKQNLRAGALVIGADATTRATVRGGPAAQAGIAANDILLAVDGESITESVTLAEILTAYDPGDTARFTLLRAGQTITLSVTLGDYVNLVY
jgi:S1-C subfamily serine protease